MNCVDPILEHARQTPDRPAVVSDDVALTYAELAERAESIAAELRRSGLIPGGVQVPRIALLCPDGPDYVLLSLGILRAGACLVPVAGELALPERRNLLEQTAAHGLLFGPGADWGDDPPGEALSLELPGMEARAFGGLRGPDSPAPEFDEDVLAEIGPAFVRFSSGTTGRSKGVVLSHGRLLERIRAANQALQIGPGDRVIWILPMAHHFAVSMMLYLVEGATTVLVGDHLAENVLSAVERHGGTVLYASPFHHTLLAADPSGRPMPGLRLAVSTAAALTEQTARAFDERFGVPLSQALGVIEVGLPAINLDAPREKPTSIGRPIPGFEMDLRDEQTGQPVADGEVGELFLRGPGMLDGYLVPWQPGEAALCDGWFRTGDLARRDADGHLYLMGRTQSVINVAGLKCFPEEIEQVLRQHPEVREARVYGRAHPQVGTVPAAEIVPQDPDAPPRPAALSKHCREALASYKRPLQFTFVDSLPKTASGKLKR